MTPKKVAFIGTGGRSVAYAAPYVLDEDIEIVALADPLEKHRKAMARLAEIPAGFAEYDDWRKMMACHDDLDGVVISTPNNIHAEPAVACYERGLPIALEKPLEVSKERCEWILNTEKECQGRSLIGFVLRSTPFYSKIHELIRDGAIGEIVSIQADELAGWGLSSIMNRSPWRRYIATSGGSLLEKCCHDMDILNWLIGCRPMSLFSYGKRLIFRGNSALPEVCDECGVAKTCPYFKKPQPIGHEDQAEGTLHKFIREGNLCIYNSDKDIMDVQSVCIEYESGAVANFLLNFNASGRRAGRNFHAIGLKGRIWGNFDDKKVYLHDNLKGETVFDASGDGSGHGGGDAIHSMKLKRMMDDPSYRPKQNAAAGYLGAVMCFASDLSRVEGRRVDLRYREDGLIDLR
ncbi:Gfo/Idh/MocA family oxidoreductase [bacterium]|nr:Gfo/Idh/MocA family oxidoreductase [bacterium]